MKTMKSVYIALFGAMLLVAGSVSVWAQAAQQTGDQTKSDASPAMKGKKKKKAVADARASQAAPDASTASSKKKSTSKKADAADKSATADSATTPKKTRSNKSASSTAAPATAATAPAAAAPATTPVKSTTAPPAATPAAPTSAPAAKTPTSQQAPPAKGAGMVWVNTDSGVYDKPGTRWYGKTKQGKYMTEADAIKAGYHTAKKE